MLVRAFVYSKWIAIYLTGKRVRAAAGHGSLVKLGSKERAPELKGRPQS